VAYIFGPPSWGQGFAAEAMHALLDFLPGLGVCRARPSLDTRNLASARLVERLGFVRETQTKGADGFKGAVNDGYVYESQSPMLPGST
jgi:[ribosomal protein S5]-alanine N-acetyltransferase